MSIESVARTFFGWLAPKGCGLAHHFRAGWSLCGRVVLAKVITVDGRGRVRAESEFEVCPECEATDF